MRGSNKNTGRASGFFMKGKDGMTGGACRVIRKNMGIITTISLVCISFVFIFCSILPVKVDNMGGAHSWLSGSTIKFVNYWLDEGAANLNLTNYENPASIEFATLEDRDPYLSYPSGETFFVYLVAKLTGRSAISISFLHKFQLTMFAVEAVLLACFIYYFLTRTLRYEDGVGKVMISALTAILWIVLPTCAYYLSSVYYADQCVILWVMSLMLIEYLFRTNNKDRDVRLKIIRSVILYTGILIDYYFWFLAVLVFIAEIIECLARTKKGKKLRQVINITLWFGIPAVLAVLTYYLQITRTSGWFDIMVGKFGERVVGTGYSTDWIIPTIFYNFQQAFSLNGWNIYCLIIVALIVFVGGMFILKRKKKISDLITDAGLSIVVCNMLAVFLQIIFFKQHSAVHEFSMIKVGWVVAILPVLGAFVVCGIFELMYDCCIIRGLRRDSSISWGFLVFYCLIVLIVGVPLSTAKFINERFENVSYDFEVMIDENTFYDDVVFSYSEEILINPPQSLAISNKRIYKVGRVSDIAEKMNGVSEDAKAILVVNKGTIPDDLELGEEKCLVDGGKIRYENDKYLLVQLTNYAGCSNR